MRKKVFITALAFALLPFLGQHLQAQKKNVLLIMADDFNYWTSKNGYYPQAKTPHIDALANKGVFFRDAHCSSPVCHPSRNALWSGIRPSTSGIDANSKPWIRDIAGLENVVTMNQYFKQNGYWVYGGGKLYHPGKMGVDETDSPNFSQINSSNTGCNGGSLYKYCNTAKSNYCFSANESAMTEANCSDYALANDIKEFIGGYADGTNSDKPFFIGVGLFRPHMPWNSPKHFWDLFDYATLDKPVGYNSSIDDPGDNVHQDFVSNNQWMRAIHGYLASCALADSNVGIMVNALENSDFADNTIVLFMGDHGWNLGEKGRWGKFDICDEANHTTLVIYDPSAAGNGQECLKPVSLQDIYPTLIDLCGLPKRKNVEGISLKPLLEDPDNPTLHTLALSTYTGTHYIKSPKWRFIDKGTSSELYNNETDPYQWSNLYGQSAYNDVVTDLRFKIDSMIDIGKTIKENYYDYMPPIPPSGLEGTIVSSTEIQLNWTDNSNNELGFLIKRQINGSGDFVLIDKVGEGIITYSDTDVNAGSTYSYYVEAYNDADTTSSETITGLQPMDMPPLKPTKLGAMPKSESEIQITWADNAVNEIEYVVYRQVNNAGDFVAIDSLPENSELFLDTGLSKDNEYAYYIYVYNSVGGTLSDTIKNIVPIESKYLGIAYPYEGTPWSIPSTTEVLAWKYDKVGDGNVWSQDSGMVIGLWNTNSGGAGQDIRNYGLSCPYEGARWNGGSVGFRENGQWARFTCDFEQSGTYFFKLRGRNSSGTLEMKILNPINLEQITAISVNYPAQCSNQGVYNTNTNWYLCNQHPVNLTTGTYVVEVAFPSPDGQGIFGGFAFEKTSSAHAIYARSRSVLINTLVTDRYLNLDLSKSNPAAHIDIYDIKGRNVQSMFVGGEDIITIELNPDLPSGVYFLNIDDSDMNITEKFIIQ